MIWRYEERERGREFWKMYGISFMRKEYTEYGKVRRTGYGSWEMGRWNQNGNRAVLIWI
jgi:hypothetical protein